MCLHGTPTHCRKIVIPSRHDRRFRPRHGSEWKTNMPLGVKDMYLAWNTSLFDRSRKKRQHVILDLILSQHPFS